MGTAAERQTEWARLVLDSLVQAGVRDAVISPGSRSTPFVLAALEREELRCTSAIDERSGAHYALGQARSTLRPSLLICTSGSAPANYFPAVVEASEAGVPLVILSADRPPELLQCGANQTTDQVGIYGKHARFFANLGEPRDDVLSLRAVRRLVSQAVSEATGVRPGPAHINAQARKPLEPMTVAADLRAKVDAVVKEPLTELLRTKPLDPTLVEPIPPVVLESVREALDAASRPVILCGPASARSAMFVDSLAELAERSGALVLAESASQLRSWSQTRARGGFDTIWRTESGRASCLPDFVLQLGSPPVSKGWELLCSTHDIARVVVHPWAWPDPSSNAQTIVRVDIGSLLAALRHSTFTTRRRDAGFIECFRTAESIVWEVVSQVLHDAGDDLTEAGATRAVFDALPDPSVLVLGNSLPIRDADTWAPPSDKLLVVHAQRGVSGIDGLVSAAAGVASVVDGPTTLLVGDISFLHDLNGLQLARGVEGPLVIVVINNGGGRIFEQLPIADDEDVSRLSYFVTPHQADLASAASTYGCTHHRARTVTDLGLALRAAYASERCSVVEAVVQPRSALEQGRDLIERVERALAREAS